MTLIKIPYATASLRYSRWERLVYRFTGRWPRSVVERRLDALKVDELHAQHHWLNRGRSA